MEDTTKSIETLLEKVADYGKTSYDLAKFKTMDKITSVAGLKHTIQILEEEQAIKGQRLKEQLYLTYESFKPAKLIQSTLKDLVSSPYIIDNLIDTTLSLAT